jgi:outer membrane protein OmpA-like peptidoglycan-associated protein
MGAPAVKAEEALPVSLERYVPTPFANRFFQMEEGAPLPHGVWRVGLDIDYGARPLVVRDQAPRIDVAGTGRGTYDLLAGVVGTNLRASVGLGHHLEAGVVLPVIAYQFGDQAPSTPAPAAFGFGSARAGLKLRILERRGFDLAASGILGFPSAERNFIASNDWSGELGLSGGYHRGPWRLGLNVGARLAPEREVFDRAVGSEWLAGLGMARDLGVRTSLLAELVGATPLASLGRSRETPVEGLAGVRHRIGRWLFSAGGGPGLVPGLGTPTFRVVAGLAFASEVPDRDEDGVDDDHDRCLDDPEDRDGFQDEDGCPDPDNDQDGILDAQDKCPLSAEDKDGFEDDDGCPDLDNDKDGIPDAQDKCPDKPETKNGFEDDDGCPDEAPPPADKDKDGILDEDDECPEEAEDKDGFEDEDGCPDPDNDKDGILDAEDKCPLEQETINGVADDDGCADKGASEVKLGRDEIETLRPIYFDTDHARVRHAFFSILGEIALLLKAHPEIGRCAVEGHTDDTGPEEWNQRLSSLRALSVVEFLAKKGVDRNRLVPIGRGEKLPWASNDTPWGRARNRRVIFHIEGMDAEREKRESTRKERREIIRQRKNEGATTTPPVQPAAPKGMEHGDAQQARVNVEERTPPVDVLPSREEAAARHREAQRQRGERREERRKLRDARRRSQDGDGDERETPGGRAHAHPEERTPPVDAPARKHSEGSSSHDGQAFPAAGSEAPTRQETDRSKRERSKRPGGDEGPQGAEPTHPEGKATTNPKADQTSGDKVGPNSGENERSGKNKPEESKKGDAPGKGRSRTFTLPASSEGARPEGEPASKSAEAKRPGSGRATSPSPARVRSGVRGAAIEENADQQDPETAKVPKPPKAARLAPLPPPPGAEADAPEKRRRHRRPEAPKAAEEPTLQDLLRLPSR